MEFDTLALLSRHRNSLIVARTDLPSSPWTVLFERYGITVHRQNLLLLEGKVVLEENEIADFSLLPEGEWFAASKKGLQKTKVSQVLDQSPRSSLLSSLSGGLVGVLLNIKEGNSLLETSPSARHETERGIFFCGLVSTREETHFGVLQIPKLHPEIDVSIQLFQADY